MYQAKANKERIEQLSQEEQRAVRKEQALAAALKRAAGEKVRDDIKLLKKSIKRKEQSKHKSQKAWYATKHYTPSSTSTQARTSVLNMQYQQQQESAHKGG